MQSRWLNILVAVVLIIMGGIPLLAQFGILIPNPLGFISGVIRILVLALAVVWLVLDAGKEGGPLKRATQILALGIVAFLGVALLNMLGISISLPIFLLRMESYILAAAGILLLIGSFK